MAQQEAGKTPEKSDTRDFGTRWAALRQRVVDELRREHQDLMPVHLRVIEESGLLGYASETLYDHSFDRWVSDVKWCAELFGEDPSVFLCQVRNDTKSVTDPGLKP